MRRTAFFFLLLSLALPVHAQIGSIERLTIDSSPAFPSGGETVFLSVRSVLTDLDRANIAWYANGELIASGSGQRAATALLGPLGSETDITVDVTTEEGDSLSTERTLRPAEVDILWEGTSYVPPFYEGRRLPSSNSMVRAEAVSRLRKNDGTMIPAKDIVYTWRKNDGIVASISGRGKSVATFPAPELLGEDALTVEAASLDGSLIASAGTRIPTAEPFVLLYQDHPLFGVLYHQALEISATFPDVEATFAALPYFADAEHPNDSLLSYLWRVNGASIAPDPQDPSRLTINAENSDGTANIELSVSHRTDYLMSARGIWNLLFNSGLGTTGIDLFGAPQ